MENKWQSDSWVFELLLPLGTLSRSLFVSSIALYSVTRSIRSVDRSVNRRRRFVQKMVGGAHPTNVLDLSIQQERSGARCAVVFVKMQNLLLKVEIDIPWGSRNPERFHKTNLQ